MLGVNWMLNDVSGFCPFFHSFCFSDWMISEIYGPAATCRSWRWNLLLSPLGKRSFQLCAFHLQTFSVHFYLCHFTDTLKSSSDKPRSGLPLGSFRQLPFVTIWAILSCFFAHLLVENDVSLWPLWEPVLSLHGLFFATDVVYDSAKPVFGVWPLKLLLCYLLGQLRVGQVSVNIWEQ